MNHLQKSVFALLLFVAAMTAANAESPGNNFVGQYVSANAGATYINTIYDVDGSNGGFLGAGGMVFAGSQINPYFAPEVGLGYFSFGSQGGISLFGLNARVTFPIGSCISLFAKLGAGYAEVITRLTKRVQKNSFVPTLGLGVGYGFSESTMATFETNGVWLPHSLGNAHGYAGGVTLGVTHYWNS